MEDIANEARARLTVHPGRVPRIGSLLGEGAFGKVYLGEDPQVVVKILENVHRDEEWCVFAEDGTLVRDCGPRRKSALKWVVDLLRDNPDMARGMSVGRVQWYADPRGRTVYLNGFLNEALASLAVQRVLVDTGRATCFARIHDAWRDDRAGYMVFDRYHDRVDRVVGSMSTRDWKSLFLIVLAGIHASQQLLHFKHHDLHLPNIMLRYLRAPPPGLRDGARRLAVPPVPKCPEDIHVSREPLPIRVCVLLRPDLQFEIELPLNGSAMPYVTDFGMASWGSAPRVQRVDISAFNGSKRWGEYSASLEGFRGYDAQVMVGDALDTLRREVGVSEIREWLTVMQRRLHAGGAASTSLGRAPPGRASDVPPIALLESDLFAEFRVAMPTAGVPVVVNLL
jgi:serine/threonine protein kinase